MLTKTRPIRPLPGYLYRLSRRAHAGRGQPILLKVACPCGKWHTHGAGTVEQPMDYPAGTVTHRVSHCQAVDYREIVVRAEPFRETWATPQDRISTVYLRWPGQAA